MSIKKIISFTIIVITSVYLYAQEKDRIYFDTNFKETTKNSAVYYRELPLKEKDGFVLVKDYYISGALQMEGWADKDDLDFLEGDVKWYYENGNLQQFAHYVHDPRMGMYGVHGTLKEYYENGKLKKEVEYFGGDKSGKANYYDENGELTASFTNENNKPFDGKTNCFSTYKNGKLVEEKFFYENSNQLAYEAYYDENGVKENFYYKNGDIIKKMAKGRNQIHKGVNITFYPSNKCGYVIGIKQLKTLRNDMPQWNEFFYDRNGEIKFKGRNEYGGPFEGSFFKKNMYYLDSDKDVLSHIETYKRQKITNIKTFIGDSLVGNIDYVNNKPFKGEIIDCDGYSCAYNKYKDGVLDGRLLVYKKIDDIREGKISSFYHMENGKKQGESSVYNKFYGKNFNLLYKDDLPFTGELVDNNRNILLYKEGKIVGEKKKLSHEGYIYFLVFKNGKKTGIEYFFNDDNGNKIEPGIYKNNKPFKGYFLKTNSKSVIRLNYYKNGVYTKKLIIKPYEYEETTIGN